MRARSNRMRRVYVCVVLCRPCHDFVTTHPAKAEAEGFLLSSWATPATDQPNGATS